MHKDKIRGSYNIPLSAEGIREAEAVGKSLRNRGGLDELWTSSLDRARQTAAIVGKHNNTKPLEPGKSLHPWHLGMFEGASSDDAAPSIKAFIKNPDIPVPGNGGTEPGESFNNFKTRYLTFFRPLLERAEREGKKIGVVSHYRNQRLTEAWLNDGNPDNLNVNTSIMAKNGSNPPSGIVEVGNDGNFRHLSLNSSEPLKSGKVYLIRHGKTAWNS